MSNPDLKKFYLMWTGSLNMGDTPGVFNDAEFAGILLQLPVQITFVSDPKASAQILLMTTEVEIFSGKSHSVYWDWKPGTPLPTPVGFIDDAEIIPGKREFHLLTIPASSATVGKHSITIHVNPEVSEGMRDDFVLKRMLAHESIGAKLGW
jgi:hypothetical protein